MLASELRKLTIEQLQSLSHTAAVEMVRRVEEAEESTAAVRKGYDMLADVSEVWQAEVKVLREACEAASQGLRMLVVRPVKGTEAVIKNVCDELLDGLERAKALEQ